MALEPDVHEALLAAIPEAIALGRRALESRDAVSGPDHWLPSDRDVRHQHRRSAEAWATLAPFLDHGPELLDHAEAELRSLMQSREPPDLQTISRHRSQLTALHNAITGGRREHAGWEAARKMVLPGGEEILRRMEVLRNAHGSKYALAWVENAEVLVEIHQAVRAVPSTGLASSAQAEAARARSAVGAAPGAVPDSPAPSAPTQQAPKAGRTR